MAELIFTTDMHSTRETIFDLIADLPNYDKWLPPSTLYAAVTKYSELPIRAGTTYTDKGKMSVMQGTVTEFERPGQITFRQVTASPLLGKLDIQVSYVLEAAGDNTHLKRTVTVHGSGLYWLAVPMLLGSFRTESERILAKMKGYLEATP